MVNGKAKGNQFERDQCRRLSTWISNGTRDDLLWRSNSSGGQFTQLNKRKTKEVFYECTCDDSNGCVCVDEKGRPYQPKFESQAGDIVSIDPLSKPFMDLFTVELKTYNSLELQGLLYLGKYKITAFWKVHVALAKKVQKIPMLIGKELRKPVLILLPPKAINVFKYSKAPLLHGDFVILQLEDFLADNPYQDFIEHVKEWRYQWY